LFVAGVSEFTHTLEEVERGNPKAADQILPLVYSELRKLAASKMAGESSDQTLQPTALVHEAWLRLTGNQDLKWEGRAHFFAAAAESMRRILIDRARRKHAVRHGGNHQRVEFLEEDLQAGQDDAVLLAINEALDKLAALDHTKAELVKLRYFVGMTIPEASRVLGISEPTAKRYWSFSRAWLYQEIQNPSH
jgi:RNA polymerase sigma factor (TIGR02999 family)